MADTAITVTGAVIATGKGGDSQAFLLSTTRGNTQTCGTLRPGCKHRTDGSGNSERKTRSRLLLSQNRENFHAPTIKLSFIYLNVAA